MKLKKKEKRKRGRKNKAERDNLETHDTRDCSQTIDYFNRLKSLQIGEELMTTTVTASVIFH